MDTPSVSTAPSFVRASGKGVFSEWEKNVSLRSGQTKTVTLRLIYAKEIPKAYVKSKPQQ